MKRYPYLRAPLAGALVLAAGCAGTTGGHGGGHDAIVPAGSTIVLEQRLEVPAGAARVHVQDGRVIRSGLFGDRNRFEPYCSFGLERSGGERLPRVIAPDRFTTGTPRSRARVRAPAPGGVQLASRAAIGPLVMEDPGGGLGHLTFITEIPLRSAAQPAVDDLTCAVDRPNYWRGRVGLESMRRALGDVATVEPAD